MEVNQFDTKYAMNMQVKTSHTWGKYNLKSLLKCIESRAFKRKNVTPIKSACASS